MTWTYYESKWEYHFEELEDVDHGTDSAWEWSVAFRMRVRGSNLLGKFGKGLLFSQGVAICQYPHYRK